MVRGEVPAVLDPLSPPDLANSVTAFSTLGAGVATLTLDRLVQPQPLRWRLVYLSILVTGIPTLGWHGFGGELWRVSDVGSNLLVGLALQLAVLGDFWPRRTQRMVGGIAAAANGLAIAWMVREATTGVRSYAIDFGSFGGFYAGEAMLIADALVVTGLLWSKRDEIPPAARPLLRVVTATFLLGLGLATADGSVVHARVISYHAIWHVVGGFGFVFLWAFNLVRLQNGGLRGDEAARL